MKNSILIDLDTERDEPVLIGKNDTLKPTNREEAQEVILTDISTVIEGLISLIHVADQNDYGSKDELVSMAVAKLNQYLTLPTNVKNDDGN